MMDQCAEVLSSSDGGSRGNHHNHDNGDAHDVFYDGDDHHNGDIPRSTDCRQNDYDGSHLHICLRHEIYLF